MFQATHILVSRSRRIPVIVTSGTERSQIYTQQEWEQEKPPAFELHSKLGMFCRGIQVLGYRLEPVEEAVAQDMAEVTVGGR
ncbi:hypothetical protein [Leptolyngbya sp. PCC 6406]|uniref:hypothetical protein n=1 Tax=Leptolyngbya sp. PCC 6406 TaxID=1173264 RepID=UPI0002ABB257|nr:hypothetical protein [Leptolyngbya sp. PCC 6406]